MTKKKPIFRQVDAHKYSKLGVRRKKKQKYRKPSGRDNKIRLNEAGRLRKVKIGFKNKKSGRGLIKKMEVVMVYNVDDLKKIKENMIGIIAKVGAKKKKQIAEYVFKNKIMIGNINVHKFLKEIEDKMKKVKEEKKSREQKKKVRDKKSKEKDDKKKKEDDKSKDEDKKDEKKTEAEKEDKKLTDDEKKDKKEENKLTNDEKKVKASKVKEKGK